MVKVLHVIPSIGPTRGGPSHAVIAMVKALREQGVDAEIATTNDNGPDLLDVPLHQRVSYKSVPVWFFPRFSPPIHSVREFAFSSSFTKWLIDSVRDYDLLHVHAIFSYASTVAMTIARLQRVPYIVRPLGQLCEWSLQQSATKKQIYLKLIERANLNSSRGLHLTSYQEQQEVSHLGLATKNFILPHGLSVPPLITDARQRLREYLNLPLDEPIILFLSRLHHKKGLDYLIPALAKTHQRFTFVIAGSGDKEYEAEVESLVVANGIKDRTRLVGFVAGETKDLFLQGSDLFALTSHSENFGVAVLEALAAGVPVLVTPGVALAATVLEYQVGVVTELDVCAIADAVEGYFGNPHAAIDMSHRARQLVVEKFSWNHISQSLNEVYQQAVG